MFQKLMGSFSHLRSDERRDALDVAMPSVSSPLNAPAIIQRTGAQLRFLANSEMRQVQLCAAGRLFRADGRGASADSGLLRRKMTL